MSDALRPSHDDLSDFEQRGQQQRRRFHGREPKPVAQVMAELIQRRGYAQVRVAAQWDQAWREAAGPEFAAATQVGVLRRGVLEITAANSLVVQELTFEKERLLAAMQQSAPHAVIKQLRFKVGQIG
jgi:predicted nucleic acid-binding Zn ribbon protein